MEKQLLQWHPAFQAACQVELREDEEFLQFFDEHTLTKKPLQMDILIIKVKSGHAVRKSIGKIFRKHNIIEYKSPDDYICINDFYKVMGYACIYQSDTKKVMDIRPEDMTVTLVCSHYPREMMNHIEKRFGVEPEEVYKGIYHVKGLLFPLQMVITKRLPKEEYTWLSRLQRNLDVISDIEPLAIAYKDVAHDPRACLKIHSRHLHAPFRGRFGPNSVSAAHCASFIGAKSPTKCDAQLSESNFQTRSSTALRN